MYVVELKLDERRQIIANDSAEIYILRDDIQRHNRLSWRRTMYTFNQKFHRLILSATCGFGTTG